jgi:hypothetical protein
MKTRNINIALVLAAIAIVIAATIAAAGLGR